MDGMHGLLGAIFGSVVCLPRELAALTAEYARHLPVKFKYHEMDGTDGVLDERVIDAKGKRDYSESMMYCAIGQDTFATMTFQDASIPYTWRIQIQGARWFVGVLNAGSSSESVVLCHDGRRAITRQVICAQSEVHHTDLTKAFRALNQSLKECKMSFADLSFDMTLTVDRSLLPNRNRINSLSIQIRSISVTSPSHPVPPSTKLQAALDQLVGRPCLLKRNIPKLGEWVPYVAVAAGGRAQLIDPPPLK